MSSPSPAHTPTQPATRALLCLALLASACSESDSAEPAAVYHAGPGLHQPLALHFADGPPTNGGSKETRKMDLPENIAPWKIYCDESEIILVPARDGHEAFRALRMDGKSSMRVDIRGPHDPATFNQVAVTVWCTQLEDFLLLLKRNGKNIVKTTGRRVQGGLHPKTVLFDIPETGLEDEPFTMLSVVFAGRSGRAGIVSVSLVQRPWFEWLPSATDPSQAPTTAGSATGDNTGDTAPTQTGELVLIGNTTHRAVGLSSHHPLESTFEATPHSRLAFSFGVPLELRHSDRAPELHLRVAASGQEPLTKSFPIDIEGDGSGWQTGTLDLGARSGLLTAHFSLEGPKNTETLCALGELSLQQLGESPPTVLLITSDTHRSDYVGFSNSGVEVRTPILDALAKKGLVFEDCATSTNVTNPSHVALMTGTSVAQTALVGNDTPLAEIAPTLAEAFRDGGFATWAALSANHLGHSKSGLGQGFERMSTPTAFQRNSPQTIAEFTRWLPDAKGQPLFLWLHLFDVHAPYAPPDDWKNMYYPEGADPYDESLPVLPNYASPKWDRQVRDLAYFEALYRSEISFQDDQLGTLLDHPRLQNALLAFTSDHGESLGDHEICWDHRELYPNTLMVPLLLHGPNVPSSPEGLRSTQSVRQIDLGRTLLDLAGLYGEPFPGTNLLDPTNDHPVRYSLSANGTSAAIMLEDWFLALHLKAHKVHSDSEITPIHSVELYDLKADPNCLTNQATTNHAKAKELRQRVIHWLTTTEQKGWTVTRNYQDLAALEQLTALGYTTTAPHRGERTWFRPDCTCEHCTPFH